MVKGDIINRYQLERIFLSRETRTALGRFSVHSEARSRHSMDKDFARKRYQHANGFNFNNMGESQR